MKIRQIVNNLTKKHETHCPFELAKRLKVEVEYVNLGKKMLGFYSMSKRVPVITINSNTDYNQKLFICGHELGHHVLQPGINTPFLTKNTFLSTDRFEIEAHTFAMELLFIHKEVITDDDLNLYGIPKQLALLRKYE